jgi:dimethylhistidine N-methyltransferase
MSPFGTAYGLSESLASSIAEIELYGAAHDTMNTPYPPAAVARAEHWSPVEPSIDDAPRVDVDRVAEQTQADTLRDLSALKRGLFESDARIDPKYFYDPIGCALFNTICTLPEYYLTRTEAAIFERHRSEILSHLPAPMQWIDLGCGSGEKSLSWIGAARAKRFIGVDIAHEWLDGAVRMVAERLPGVEVLGVVTDFSQTLAMHETLAQRPNLSPVFFYPGSSLGNFSQDGALAFLQSVRSHVDGGGALLIGVDLVKDARILEAAYDDTAGVTAAFNRNVLHVVNRLLDADFDPERFAHVARFNRQERRIEMHLRSNMAQIVTIDGERRAFGEGECILTECSYKYTLGGFAQLLAAAGFTRQKAWTDAAGWFGVFVARP